MKVCKKNFFQILKMLENKLHEFLNLKIKFNKKRKIQNQIYFIFNKNKNLRKKKLNKNRFAYNFYNKNFNKLI